jgi:Zn-dependent peptidase ImmA (M78 family)/transcriptional regulator with XRE-family HTH domain
MSSALNGQMLRLARQYRGFQQGEAAAKLGMTQATLSRAENGVVVPSDDLLGKAEKLYRLPASFFAQTDPVYGAPVSVHAMFRRKASVTARELDKIIAELNIRTIHLRKLLEGADLRPAKAVPRLDIERYGGDAEEVAELVRAHWQIPAGPVANLTAVAETAGIIVAHSDLAGADVDGVKYEVAGLPPIVLLNSRRPADRMRFSLAHEIGHLVMHHVPSPDMEDQANLFAGAFLLPRREMKAAFSRRLDLRRLAELKPEWKVSMQALLYRAKTIGAVDEGKLRYLWQQFNVHRIRLQEPPELDFPVERPTVLSKLLSLHLNELGYTIGALAQTLNFDSAEFEKVYGLTVLTSEPRKPVLRVVK